MIRNAVGGDGGGAGADARHPTRSTGELRQKSQMRIPESRRESRKP